METFCWKIRVDTSGFSRGVIMAQCYGIILWFKAMRPGALVEHPGSADLSRTMRSEARKVIGSVEQGMGMGMGMVNSEASVGNATATK